MLCVPVPGTINAVAAKVRAAVIVEARPMATAPSIATIRTATERTAFRISEPPPRHR